MEAHADTSDAAPRKTLGATLAAERERQGLSRADAAQRLHMSAWQVEALETGDFARLPKGTFLRGFVRNYTKVLGLAPEAVMPLLVEDAPTSGRPGIVVPTQNIRFDPLHERLQNPYVKAASIAAVVILVALAAMYWWVFIRPAPPAGAARKPTETSAAHKPKPATPEVVASAPISPPLVVLPETAPVTPPPAPSTSPSPSSTPGTTAAPPKAPATTAKPAASASAPASPPAATPAKPAPAPAKPVPTVASGDGAGKLKFRFRGESWVEIRDGRGKIILSKLNAAGSEAEVTGQPPFNLIVGNAPEVELSYNDHSVDLESHTKVAVARLTVE